jgi:hypothetical protein
MARLTFKFIKKTAAGKTLLFDKEALVFFLGICGAFFPDPGRVFGGRPGGKD